MARHLQSGAGLFRAEILENRPLSSLYFYMALRMPGGFPPCRPGQFLHIKVTEGLFPLLRRPFSLLDVSDGKLHLLLKEVGRGTSLLRARKPGEVLDLLGPLGSEFPRPRAARVPLLVGGGVGLAPLFFLAAELTRAGSGGEARVFFGAGTEPDLFVELLDVLPWKIHLATLDGSKGYPGNCVELFAQERKHSGWTGENATLYACGPRGMLTSLVRSQKESFPDFYVSMEEAMGCGMGACRGCSLPTPRGVYLTTCTHGPVFETAELDWDVPALA